MHIVCMYVCTRIYEYICMYIRTYIHGCIRMCMHVQTCICVRGYVCVGLCVWLLVTVFRTRYRRPGPDLDLCSLWTRYNGDSKTGPWDDPQISTSSCSEDQMAIQFRNRVISCECSFLCTSLFTVVGMCLHVTLIISCDFLLYFTSLIICTTS